MEHAFVVKGGNSLHGNVEIRGSKNASSKLMIASLLTEDACIIENVPLSQETDITKELCEAIGSAVLLEGNTCTIHTPRVKNSLVSALSRKNRIPILATGPLLHRRGFAEIPVPGGCPIGHRPINLHIEAFNKMGIRVERRENSYYAEVSDVIRGADIEFSYPSVGATESVLLTAVLAEGVTTIKNAAMEPEIMNLIQMLSLMGSNISVDESERKIQIQGVSKLHGARVRTIPDRNEIVSFAAAALATDGEVFIKNIDASYLESFLSAVSALGGKMVVQNEGILFSGNRPYSPFSFTTTPHPGFMTDWQQPLCVVLTQVEGESIIHETVYEDRFGYVKDLRQMGAQIEVSDECIGASCRFNSKMFNHSARVRGWTQLRGASLDVGDLRAGMAHLVAALSAKGESVITGISHIDRGYERIEERLQSLGADVKRVTSNR